MSVSSPFKVHEQKHGVLCMYTPLFDQVIQTALIEWSIAELSFAAALSEHFEHFTV